MPVFVGLALAAKLAAVPGAELSPADWEPLVKACDFGRARSLCEGALESEQTASKTEAHKCLANVELSAHGEHAVQIGGDAGGGFIGPGYDEEPALKALAHLEAALQLAPGDLSIHQARLHVLLLAGMYGRMKSALEESARLYAGNDALDAWIAVTAELFERRQFATAESLLFVLDRRFPGDHRVAGNFAAVYGMQARDAQALAWALKAVQAAPKDPTDAWNLARVYDFMGRIDRADASYRRALALQPEARRKETTCLYATFLFDKQKDRRRACELQRKAGCDATTACDP